MKRIIYSILAIGLFIGFFNSCTEESLDPTLAQEKAIEQSVNSAEALQGVLLGAYDRLTQTAYYGRDYIVFAEVMSDNCFANGASGRFLEPSAMDLGPGTGYVETSWRDIYEVVASTNAILTKDKANLEGDAAAIDHIFGQAYAIRALAHFDMLKLYGQQHVDGSDLGVPYITTFASDLGAFGPTDFFPERQTVSEVKDNIYADLNSAIEFMSADMNDDSKQYMTTYGAQALKSRIALYFGDWGEVVTSAEAVIGSGNYSIIAAENYVDYWASDGGPNSIFELAYTSTDNNNINGLAYIYRGDSYGDVEVLPNLATIFDSSDVRMTGQLTQSNGVTVNMLGPGAWRPEQLHNNGKYPNMVNYSDNIPLIRYEEVILNYAEALFELDQSGMNGQSALDYLNMIPNHRNAPPYAEINKDNILQERRRELCFEGFRFHDLARTGLDIPYPDPSLQEHGGPDYGSYNYAFPIPEEEINANKNMVQNQGYLQQ
ncbi:MAG: RagB/SusD family nutrient uptake outer membrane protein [Bacteroidales bacterium]|nr:RagB/SusD family nutrient uptake outer membrane protein [Bacteroidales bacterium]MBS3776849.1 RagB/SusD family nutrient uptake outer membrane protein [Bacteroidales bacterium]